MWNGDIVCYYIYTHVIKIEYWLNDVTSLCKPDKQDEIIGKRSKKFWGKVRLYQPNFRRKRVFQTVKFTELRRKEGAIFKLRGFVLQQHEEDRLDRAVIRTHGRALSMYAVDLK